MVFATDAHFSKIRSHDWVSCGQVYPNGDGGGRGADVCIIGILGAGKGTENGTGAGAGECWMTSHV